MHHPLNDVATIRRIALYVGIPALAVACLMTFQFGRSMSLLHAVVLALLTVAGSVVFPYAKHVRQQSAKLANGFVLMGLLFLSAEYFSHLGYTVGTRVLETEDTGVQNAVYKNAQETLAQNKADKAMWIKNLDELKLANGWVTTVTPAALQAQIAIAQKDIDLEAARKGCKQKCRDRMKDKADLESKIAIINTTDDLQKRIEATQRLIDKATVTAADTKHKSSSVVAQTNFVAQIASGSLDPDALSSNWTQIWIGAFLALVSTFLAPVMFSIAFGPPTSADNRASQQPRQSSFAPSSGHATVEPGQDRYRVEVINKTDRSMAEGVLRAIRQSKFNGAT